MMRFNEYSDFMTTECWMKTIKLNTQELKLSDIADTI